MNNTIETLDGREIPCSIKHGMIIAKWQALPVGQSFILINNHEPVRLKNQFGELWPETFAWQCDAKGPEEFHIQITKLKPLPVTAEPLPLDCGH
jgi:uncharacterized protein (DUF2249 family)